MTKSKVSGNVTITLCLAEDEGLDSRDGGKWLLMCETHGGIIQDTNKSRLWGWATQPQQFCHGCRNEVAA